MSSRTTPRPVKAYLPTHVEQSGYYLLAAAILESACRDYIMARRTYKRAKRSGRRATAAGDIVALLRFFHSEWCGLLCDIDPDRMISMLDYEADHTTASFWQVKNY